MKLLLIAILAIFSLPSKAEDNLPARFENNLIYLEPILKDGQSIRFFTDTGGGWNAISQELVDQNQWPTSEKKADGKIVQLVDMPNFKADASIPLGGINNFMEGKLFVAPAEKISRDGTYSGVLGGRWHAEKIIDFDYPNESMSVLSKLPKLDKFVSTQIGFQKNKEGNYTTAFPSIIIEVEGELFPMLLDTGASAWPSDKAKKLVGQNGQRIATSFIVASIFDSWVAKHPNWLVIENACQFSKESMIRVPAIKVAGVVVGPVWFTRRKDHNFHRYMSSMMDRKVDGALGGSALKYVRVIVDYPKEKAYLQSFNDARYMQ